MTETGKARQMSSDEPAAENGGQHGRLPFDTSVAHQARVYDYLLGSKVDVLHTL
jgi:hypothetical protein